jgi:hypothetical protein
VGVCSTDLPTQKTKQSTRIRFAINKRTLNATEIIIILRKPHHKNQAMAKGMYAFDTCISIQLFVFNAVAIS